MTLYRTLKRAAFKCSHYKEKWQLGEVKAVWINLTVVTILQYIRVSSYDIYLKTHTIFYIKYISVRLGWEGMAYNCPLRDFPIWVSSRQTSGLQGLDLRALIHSFKRKPLPVTWGKYKSSAELHNSNADLELHICLETRQKIGSYLPLLCPSLPFKHHKGQASVLPAPAHALVLPLSPAYF